MLGSGNALGHTVLPAARRGAPRPLDAYTGSLYAAYGLQRLLTAYAGPCVRVRRSTNAAETDIGFTALGQLDTPTLLAFAGAGTATIAKWYDQTGNARHAAQATASAQPRIVDAGVLDVGPSGKPTSVYSGSQFLSLSNAGGFARNATNLTVAACAQPVTSTDIFGTLFSCSLGASIVGYRIGLLQYLTANLARFAVTTLDTTPQPFVQRSATTGSWWRYIGRARCLDNIIEAAVNGSTTSAALGTSGPTVDTDCSVNVIGRLPNGSQPFSGGLSALILSREAHDIPALDAALEKLMS